MGKVHIGKIIKQVVRQQQLTDVQFGQLIGLTRDGVQKIYPKEFIDTELLTTISKSLNYDFFGYFSRELSTVQEQSENFGKVTQDDLQRLTALLYRLSDRIEDLEKRLPAKKKSVRSYRQIKPKRKK